MSESKSILVLVDPVTQCRVANPKTREHIHYDSERMAKAMRTRLKRPELLIMDYQTYRAQVPKIRVKSLMPPHTEVEYDADTPFHCRVDSHAYWEN